jgi:phage I-like protein
VSEYTKDQPVEALAFNTSGMEIDGLKTIRIAPDGEVRSKNGVFIVDREGTAEIIAEFQRHGVDLVVDFDHATLGGKYATPDGQAPAAGWIEKLFHEPGRGLMGLVKWNEKARDLIRSDEYRYLSPVLSVRKNDRRAIALLSAGLTNTPAIPASERLAASTRLDDVGSELMPQADEGATKSGGSLVGAPTELMKKLRDVLGLEQCVSVGDVLKAAIAKLQGKSDDESKDTEVAESVRARLGLASDAGAHEVTLALSLREDIPVRAEQFRLADERVQELCKAGVLNPNDTVQIASARGLLIDDPERFEQLIGNMKALSAPPPGKTTAPPRPTAGIRARHSVIAGAMREFHSDQSAGKLTSYRAFVDLRLREAGLGKLADAEATEYEVV